MRNEACCHILSFVLEDSIRDVVFLDPASEKPFWQLESCCPRQESVCFEDPHDDADGDKGKYGDIDDASEY